MTQFLAKDIFLNQNHVKGFVRYLAEVLDGRARLNHQFTVKDRKIPPGYVSNVKIDTLEDAFNNYFWDKERFSGNEVKLSKLSAMLKLARNSNDNQSMFEAIEECMAWGLGRGRKAYTANVAWANTRKSHLCELMLEAEDCLSSDRPDIEKFKLRLRMNAGYTKVFALLCPNFLIYDGRVGGALGYLVRRYCEEYGLSRVPDQLSFPWAPGAGNAHRNPSKDNYNFPRLNNNSKFHAEWNIKANWIVHAAQEFSQSNWWRGEDSFRRIEAALFMIGYSFDSNP